MTINNNSNPHFIFWPALIYFPPPLSSKESLASTQINSFSINTSYLCLSNVCKQNKFCLYADNFVFKNIEVFEIKK